MSNKPTPEYHPVISLNGFPMGELIDEVLSLDGNVFDPFAKPFVLGLTPMVDGLVQRAAEPKPGERDWLTGHRHGDVGMRLAPPI